MQTRHVIAGLFLIALLGVGLWSLKDTRDFRLQSTTAATAKPSVEEIPAPEVANLTLPDSIASQRQAIETAAIAAAPAPVGEHGTIVVLDEAGIEHASESGTFSLHVFEPRADPIEVQVNKGKWTATLPEGARFMVTMIRLGGRSALLLPRSEPMVARAHLAQFRCQWTRVTRLHVVDAKNGAELDDLRLYRASAWEALGVDVRLELPTSAPIGLGLSSPLEIPFEPSEHDSGLPMHFVQRAGYALGNIQIDPLAGGEFFLRLEPVGSLRLAIDGANRDPKFCLHLYQELGTELNQVGEWRGDQLGKEPRPMLVVEGLVGGPYKVRAEVGSTEAPRILAEQEFAIVAGVQSEVVLAVDDLPPDQKVEVVVTVKFGAGWSLSAFELGVYSLDVVINHNYRIQKISSASMSASEPGTWTSAPIALDTGRCRFAIDKAHFAKEVVLGPGARQEVIVEVPAPGKVIARVIDGASGKPVNGASCRWGWKGPLDKRAHIQDSSLAANAAGEFEFMAPCGTVEVEASAGEHAFAYQVLEVVSGTNNVTLVLEPGYSIEFVLREGDKIVPWPLRAMNDLKFERVDDLPMRGISSSSFGSGRATCYVTQPGAYRLSFAALSGYRAVEPFEVVLDRSSPAEKVIQLVRE